MEGRDEEITIIRENRLNIEQTKTLDKTDSHCTAPGLAQGQEIKENNPSVKLDVIYESSNDTEMSDDELNFMENESHKNLTELSILSMIEGYDDDNDISPDTAIEAEKLKSWRPNVIPPYAIQELSERKIFRANGGLTEPSRVTRIPVEISFFGEKVRGILDSGSERSFLSQAAYDRVKTYQVKELIPDATSKKGVRLGNRSVVRTKGGTCFIIDIGDVYGPQWFSVLPGLSNAVILGMDFWLSFKVRVDPIAETWKLQESEYSYPITQRNVTRTELKALTIEENDRLKTFLDTEFSKLDKESTGVTDLIEHVIRLTSHRVKPYRRREAIREFINKDVDRLLEKGYIVWSNSDWACSPVVAPKAHGGLRFCIDYRPLNRQTVRPAYPLQHMKSILSQLHQAKIISTLDMSEAFHQIPMEKNSRKYTAFVVEGKGLLEWVRMPYGLTGAPSTFQSLMDKLKRRVRELIIERNLPNKWPEQVFAYLDDWIIVSETFDEHLAILSLLFEVIREAKLKINREKSSFACKEVKFLGYIVDELGIRPNPEKIQPILDFPMPKDRTQLRQFNGLVN